MYFSTDRLRTADRGKAWSRHLSGTYFPLSADCRDPERFRGRLKSWELGSIGLSEMHCDAVRYHRNKAHFRDEADNSLLITIPLQSEIRFEQASRLAKSAPGSFLVERGDLPYRFSHAEQNRLWVLKVPTASVQSRLGNTDRLGALTFDATSGTGAYFAGAVRNAIENVENLSDTAREMAGLHLVDLLCLALRSDDRILDSAASNVRAAHLQRAEHFIRDNLANPRLGPQLVAESCGISLRYLHELFSENAHSVAAYIRDKRLTRCHEQLALASGRQSIGQIALDWGFYDQAQFSNHYRARFGCTPGDTRKQARSRAAAGD